jgi:hypothetical protein
MQELQLIGGRLKCFVRVIVWLWFREKCGLEANFRLRWLHGRLAAFAHAILALVLIQRKEYLNLHARRTKTKSYKRRFESHTLLKGSHGLSHSSRFDDVLYMKFG